MTGRAPSNRRRVRRAAVLGAAALAAAGLVIAGCGSSSDDSSSTAAPAATATTAKSLAGTTITLYNSQHEQTTAALIKAFTAQTGIKVRVKQDDESVLTAQIEQEGKRSPADVFFTENSNWLEQLDERGLLAKVDDATLAQVPARDNAANGQWLGVSARISTMIYNTKKFTPAQMPKSVMDLADPKWKGKLMLSPGETDFWPIVSSIARTKGKPAAAAWLKAIKANAGSNDNVADNEAVVADISKGAGDIALINHYYFYRLRDEAGSAKFDAAIQNFAPGDVGYVEDIAGAGIMKSSKNQAGAQKFLEFLTGEAGQKVLAASESFEYPIHPGVAANPKITPLDQLKPNAFTPAQLGTGLDAKNLLQDAGLL
jgi:iron(III) transport system substrate-binding protein